MDLQVGDEITVRSKITEVSSNKQYCHVDIYGSLVGRDRIVTHIPKIKVGDLVISKIYGDPLKVKVLAINDKYFWGVEDGLVGYGCYGTYDLSCFERV